jgi:hypothetical protein
MALPSSSASDRPRSFAQGAVDAQEAAVQADQRHPDGGLVETEAEVHLAPLASPHSDEWVVHRV